MKETINSVLNPLPTLTWNWLAMNRAKFDAEVDVNNGGVKVSCSKLPKGVTYIEDAEKEVLSVQEIDTALGKNFSSMLHKHGVIPSVFSIEDGVKAGPVTMRFELKDKAANYKSLVVNAGNDTDFTLILDFTSAKKDSGINAVQTKIYAGKNAKVHLVTVQFLGRDFIHFNDIGTIGEEGSLVDVTQIELGGKKLFAGVYSTLTKQEAAFKNDMAYYLQGDQELDMNFVAAQTGKRTDSCMHVYGTLKDGAKKTYRGTIDFRKGCSGATGDEQEEVLLLSPAVVNKSIPLILCDEEDVSGEHGASIGRLDDDILFYMNSRGISLEAAQQIMVRAKIARVASLIGDEATENKISDFLDEIL